MMIAHWQLSELPCVRQSSWLPTRTISQLPSKDRHRQSTSIEPAPPWLLSTSSFPRTLNPPAATTSASACRLFRGS